MTTTSETLNRAADLIEERGWKRGAGWRAEDGGLCLEGGIIAAQGLNFDTLDLNVFWACPAYQAVQSYLGFSTELSVKSPNTLPSPDQSLWGWNDDQTKGRVVVETLRACAVIEASRERECAEASA